MIVLDSSAAVDYLAGLEHGPWVGERLLESGDLHAPHLIDVEVAGALRRLVLAGELSVRRAREALDDLLGLRLVRYPHTVFLIRMWELRTNLTAADAAFVALAEALKAPLVTTDRKLASAPGSRVPILVP